MSLKQIIDEQGRKQSWIAKELGISESAFSRMALNKQRFPADKIKPLAVLLQLDIEAVVSAVTNYKETA